MRQRKIENARGRVGGCCMDAGPCEMKMSGSGEGRNLSAEETGDRGVRSRDEDESQRGSWRIREGRIFK